MNLYISEPKTHISISGQTLIITTESEVKKFPLGLLKSICLHKNVQITSQAICRLCEEGISIAWISSDRIVCQTFGTGNVLRQKQQFDILHNDEFILNLSKRNIRAKIRNQMYLIHRPELFQETDITKCNTISRTKRGDIMNNKNLTVTLLTTITEFITTIYNIIENSKEKTSD